MNCDIISKIFRNVLFDSSFGIIDHPQNVTIGLDNFDLIVAEPKLIGNTLRNGHWKTSPACMSNTTQLSRIDFWTI